MAGRKVTRDDLRQAAEKYKNWGKWGADDEIGTLNCTSPEDIVAAAQLVKKGKVISLALNFDNNGPQGGKTNYPALGRINPLHTMLRTGTDAYSGVLDKRGIRAADEAVIARELARFELRVVLLDRGDIGAMVANAHVLERQVQAWEKPQRHRTCDAHLHTNRVRDAFCHACADVAAQESRAEPCEKYGKQRDEDEYRKRPLHCFGHHRPQERRW